MRKALSLFSLLSVSGLAAWQAIGNAPRSTVPITSLVPSSDAIVVASILQGSASNGLASVTLNVEEVLKGGLQPGTTQVALWQAPSPGRLASVSISPRRGLFFLQKAGGGNWNIVSCTLGNVDFNDTFVFLPNGHRPPEFEAGPGATILDKVLLEVAWAKQVGVPPGGAVVDLVWEYRKSRSVPLKGVLTRFAENPSPILAAIGLRALLFDGDVGALQRVEGEQATLLKSPGARDITDEIRFYFSNPGRAAVDVLGRLVTSPATTSPLKEAAAGSLARIHTREALPYLAALLDSPSVTLRTYAVGGLSMFANNVPMGSHEPAPGPWKYRTEETIVHSAMDPAHASFWRSWWLANQAEITQGR